MRYYLVLLFLISCYLSSFAQNEYGKITYESYGPTYALEANTRVKINRIVFKKLPDTSRQVNSFLYFNKHESLYKFGDSASNPDAPGKEAKINVGGKNEGAYFANSPVDEKGQLFYRNFKTKEVYFRVIKALTDAYVVKDNWVEVNWTLKEEFKEILGYRVQKAEGYFRGRKHHVWFTREIAYPYGPWKLFGLPGVILESYDPALKSGEVAVNICYPCKKEALDEIKRPEEKILRTIKEHVYYVDHPGIAIEKKINKSLKAKGSKSYFVAGKGYTVEEIKKIRRFSSEIQYEWERYPGDTKPPKDVEENLSSNRNKNEKYLKSSEQ